MVTPDYFDLRGVSQDAYGSVLVPPYVRANLPDDRNESILDFGCGFGQLLRGLNDLGYHSVFGADVSKTAISHCRGLGLPIFDTNDDDWLDSERDRYSLIVVSHVLEHIEKGEIVPTLAKLRTLLKAGGSLVVAVPNAQSHTGAYWAYEDFTHTTLFTSGSIQYVLRAAGFSSIQFLDIDCTLGLPPPKRLLRKWLLGAYRANYQFWNRVTASYTHTPSPAIFSYEIKVLARS